MKHVLLMAIAQWFIAYGHCASEFRRYPELLESNSVLWFSFDYAPATNAARHNVWPNDLGAEQPLVSTNLQREFKRIKCDAPLGGYGIVDPLNIHQLGPITVALNYSFSGLFSVSNNVIFQICSRANTNTNVFSSLRLTLVRKVFPPNKLPVGDWPYLFVLTQSNSWNTNGVLLAIHEARVYH